MPQPDESSAFPRARILCVDDEAPIRRFLVRLLTPEFDVVTAKNGAAGLELLERAGPFAVVLSDLSMPGMSGSTFLAEVGIRAPATVRVMISGRPHVVGVAEAVETGHIFRFVSKPCPPARLVEIIREAVAHHGMLVAVANPGAPSQKE
jgi:DNA-binding NtrC family response regulator